MLAYALSTAAKRKSSSQLFSILQQYKRNRKRKPLQASKQANNHNHFPTAPKLYVGTYTYVPSIYFNIAICSFLRLSVSLLSFLKKALFPPFNSLFLLLLRSMYAMVLPPDSSLSLPFVLRPPRRCAL